MTKLANFIGKLIAIIVSLSALCLAIIGLLYVINTLLSLLGV